MAFETGPADFFDLSTFDMTIEDPAFESVVLGGDFSFHVVDSELEASLKTIADGLAKDQAALNAPDPSLDSAASEIAALLDTAEKEPLADAYPGAAEVEESFIATLGALPEEVFQEPPAPFVPEPDEPGFTTMPEEF